MKKSTMILAMAAFAVLPASAQLVKEAKTLESSDVSEIQLKKSSKVSSVMMHKKGVKSPARISAVSDIYGQYEVTCQDNEGEMVTMTPTILAGSSENEVLFLNFPFSDIEYPAIVDVAAGTITFRAYDTGYYNSKYGENQIFGPVALEPREDGNLYYIMPETLVANIAEDGSIVLPTVNDYPTGFGMYISQGIFAVYLDMTIKPIEMWEYNASEWENAGKGSFTESIFNSYLVAMGDDPVPAYDVNVLRNKENKDLYLIENPYKTEIWIQCGNQTPDANGYIMIDATDPDCVLCLPLVNSGFGMDQSQEGDGSDIQGVCVFNMEAMMARQGYELDDIKDEFGANDEPVSMMEGNLISLYNNRFSFTGNLLGIYTWRNVEMLESYLEIDNSGVEGIMVDENAPVRYFNLQGVEVANPEAGQLVIKKQGSKAQKMIVR